MILEGDKMKYILYNSKANNSHGYESAKEVEKLLKDKDFKYVDMLEDFDYGKFWSSLSKEDEIIIAGGDGTLNYMVNHLSDEEIQKVRIDYFPTGTGNDFAADLEKKAGDLLEDIGKYLINLPTVTVKDKEYKFLNGVGYGIDGYCCEVGDELRLKSTKEINYTAIAIKGLLFKFKPVKATVTIDGETKIHEKVWLTPCMNGRKYGGGMIPTPKQDRLKEPKTLSVMVYKTKSKLKALMVFPKIFEGKHVEQEKVVTILTGQNIHVSFDRPCALQVDGETITGVTEYSARV